MLFRRTAVLGALSMLLALPVVGSAQDRSYVAAEPGAGRFPLVASGRAAPLHVDSQDHAGVIRVVGDLQRDIERVTGLAPEVLRTEPRGSHLVLVGTIGKSPTIDRLIRDGKLDVSEVSGKWETWLTQTVENPVPGVDRALVIAGSDKRGTIYGVYDLSEQIGVSPWYWWADVPTRRQANLYVLPGRHTQGPPAVKYRGIFINDEAPALSGWTREKFGGFNSEFYKHVFELILRLKGNYLWPAMWGNAIYADDPRSPKLADEYGVVLGTSHHEPMTRAHDEWRRFGSGAWNYGTNAENLRRFWREGIERMGPNESIVTVGMRGDGDEPMTEGTAISLLERIVADQRTILGEVTGRPPSDTPQLWALYKEVQDYYDKGMRVPEDVTLLFADDNWGNIRRLPSLADRARPGGFGVYYHFDYVGGPRNYKWINTNPISRVWEQMHLAYRYGADRIWIVNVGDIKPMEFPTDFFLDYAWNPERWPADRLPEYTREWAEQQFGEQHAQEIARILTAYTRINGRRKPELLDTVTYSLHNYREAETVVAEFNQLVEAARRLQARLPREYHDAFYQLVLHPVEASANLHELYYTVARNRWYAQQGRAATNDLADRARSLFERDAEITRTYNTQVAGGKWNHMMDQTHIGYTNWQEPPRNVMPRVDVIQVPVAAEMGVAVEGQGPARPQDGRPAEPTLPEIDAFNRQTRWIEVFNRGQTPFEYTTSTGAPWLRVAPARGRVDKEQRLEVSVDWARVPTGMHRVPITIAGPNGRSTTVRAVVHNRATPGRNQVRGFVESDGYVSMEAEHFDRAVSRGEVRWQRIPDLGRTLSGMMPMPVTAPSQTPGGASPRLEYRMHLWNPGEVTVRAYVSPTLNFSGGEGLRYAISFDDEPPQIVNIHADGSSNGKTDGNRAWEQSVANNIKVLTSKHRITRPGEHVLKFWMVDPGVVLQKLVVETGEVKPSYLGPPESFRGARQSATKLRP